MRNRCSYAGLVSAYFSVYLAGTKNVSLRSSFCFASAHLPDHLSGMPVCGKYLTSTVGALSCAAVSVQST